MKTLKEFARLLIFALPAILIQLLTNDPALAGQYGVSALILLKTLDKAIHEGNNQYKGILPF